MDEDEHGKNGKGELCRIDMKKAIEHLTAKVEQQELLTRPMTCNHLNAVLSSIAQGEVMVLGSTSEQQTPEGVALTLCCKRHVLPHAHTTHQVKGTI